MANSESPPTCVECGGLLEERDFGRGTCHDCRSMTGKIIDLEVAILAPGDDPNRIADWPIIQSLLEERFGADRSDADLWKRCTGWLRADGRLEPSDYLPLPLEALVWILRNGLVSGFKDELEQIRRRHIRARAASRKSTEEVDVSLARARRAEESTEEADASFAKARCAEESTAAQGLEDPVIPVDETPAFSLLDRFPATPAGHVAFLEMARDEIHFAAEGKRNQFAEKYSNDTIASMVNGRDALMAEASRRIATVSELPKDVVEQVARVLRRELTPSTVERIDELLTPVVRDLRDAWEDGRSATSVIEPDDAFRRPGEGDAEVRAERERTRRLLQAFAKAMQVAMDSKEYQASQEAERQQWHELAGAIREILAAAGDEVESRNLDLPETMEDWECLTRILEGRAEAIDTGNLTARDVFACALAWADRQAIKVEIAGETETEAVHYGQAEAGDSSPGLPVGFLGGAKLADALGVHPTQRNAFFQRLMRERTSLGDDSWHEVRNRRGNSPTFLYRVDSGKLRGLAAKYKTPKPT